jgi:hypothetical protein
MLLLNPNGRVELARCPVDHNASVISFLAGRSDHSCHYLKVVSPVATGHFRSVNLKALIPSRRDEVLHLSKVTKFNQTSFQAIPNSILTGVAESAPLPGEFRPSLFFASRATASVAFPR